MWQWWLGAWAGLGLLGAERGAVGSVGIHFLTTWLNQLSLVAAAPPPEPPEPPPPEPPPPGPPPPEPPSPRKRWYPVKGKALAAVVEHAIGAAALYGCACHPFIPDLHHRDLLQPRPTRLPQPPAALPTTA